MKAFVVSVNGKRLWTVGIGPNGVFSVIVGCGIGGPRRPADGFFHFHVGGLDARTDEHVEWKTPGLDVGDSVTVELVDAAKVDPETRRFLIYDTPDGKKPRPKSKGGRPTITKKVKAKRKAP